MWRGDEGLARENRGIILLVWRGDGGLVQESRGIILSVWRRNRGFVWESSDTSGRRALRGARGLADLMGKFRNLRISQYLNFRR